MARGGLRRRSILDASIGVFGTKGFRAASVADILAAARVSRTTFYKHFDDKLDCFLAAYEAVAALVPATIAASCERAAGWPEQARGGLEALLELLASEPELARVLVVEAALAGAEARRRQWAVIARAARLLDAGGADEGSELPATAGLMATSAVAGLLFDEIQAGRSGELPQRLPELLFALLVPYLGPGGAAEQMRRASSYAVASR